MINLKKKDYRKIFFLLIPLMFFAFRVWAGVVSADDHKRIESHSKRYETREHYDDNDRTRRELKKEDKGNEITGQTAAWLLVAANLTVALSILMKGTNREKGTLLTY